MTDGARPRRDRQHVSEADLFYGYAGSRDARREPLWAPEPRRTIREWLYPPEPRTLGDWLLLAVSGFVRGALCALLAIGLWGCVVLVLLAS